ncbi:beta-1,3-galactosyltransferase 5-like isoform X2 [Planococcus citri]|uniref:beta-1,3-galactosyltransferase 5-like isoform X2 n=1 Tax=Planococcus citri TaxID=170843 RepID=UPI0031FA2942
MLKKSVISRTPGFLSRVFVVNRRLGARRTCLLVIFLILLTLLCTVLYKFFTRDVELVGWEMNVSRNVTNYVYPNRDTSFSHTDPNICSEMKPLVVVVVCSDTRNSRLRNAIRDTWAKDAREKYNILVLFLVGISGNEDVNMATLVESLKYKDIIAEDVAESYNNLTIKSIFMLKWIHKKCMQARFVLKVDDDAFINLANLYNYTLQVDDNKMQDFLVGFIQTDPSPHRFHFSKWYIPRYMYPLDKYPTYVQGVAYLMSSYVAEKIYFESLRNDVIHLEDVFITGICPEKLHITVRDDPLFHFYYKPGSVACDSEQSRLIAVGHYVDVYHSVVLLTIQL